MHGPIRRETKEGERIHGVKQLFIPKMPRRATVDKIKVLSKEHNILLGGVVPLPTKKTKFTLLRSPHVNKQSREQFEIRKHSRVLRVETLDKDKVLAFIKEVGHSCPVGVTMKTTLGFITKGKV